MASLALAAIALYLLLHPYLGLTHDARLYSLQALNHLHPELYGNDVFLRYGSQDDFTFFTPLFASLTAWLGLEPAAALLTLISQLMFLAAAFLFARRLMPANLALVGLSLLLLIPNHYGSQKIFSFLESFVTPRLLAEGLVLFAIAGWLAGRRWLAAALIAGAMVTHPIMGLSGAALLAALALVLPHWRAYWPHALGALLIIGAALFGLVPNAWQFDDEWLAVVVTRADYLVLLKWSSDDWGRVVTVIATLAVGAQSLRGDMHRIALATLISTSASMLLAVFGADLLRIILVMQAQPWRAMWLATVVALLLLPAIFAASWRDKALSRCAALLLAASWFASSENLALLMAPLACVAALLSDKQITDRTARALTIGSFALLTAMLLGNFGNALLAWQTGTYNVTVSSPLDPLRNLATGGALVVFAALASYWLVKWRPGPVLPALTIGLGVAASSLVAPTLDTWRTVRVDAAMKASFAEWRALIPQGSDVLWAAETFMGFDRATLAWLLLERPSYASRLQSATSLFSRQAAIEIRDRAKSIDRLVPDIVALSDPNVRTSRPRTAEQICSSSSVRYVITDSSFSDVAPVPAPAQVSKAFRNLKLNICP